MALAAAPPNRMQTSKTEIGRNICILTNQRFPNSLNRLIQAEQFQIEDCDSDAICWPLLYSKRSIGFVSGFRSEFSGRKKVLEVLVVGNSPLAL